jgi:hypothetical protein
MYICQDAKTTIMITADNMDFAIKAFAAMQGIEIKEGGDKWKIRVVLPADAINALMSDFMDRGSGPTFKVDEDNLFYAKCKSHNISLIIQEGRTYKIENVVPNQEMELAGYEGDDLPGREPNIDHKKPVY